MDRGSITRARWSTAGSTVAQTTARMREIAAESPLGAPLEGPALTDVLSVLAAHPRASIKLGPGVKAVRVRLNEYGRRAFEVERPDGSRSFVSWTKCVGRYSEGRDVRSTFRY